MHFDIVDDEAFIRELMREIILREGFGVKTFASADDYLSYCASPDYEQPLAVLSDITMPGLGGIELIRRLRQSQPDQRLVLISGTPEDTSEVDDCLCAMIGKPFRPTSIIELLEILRQCRRHEPRSNQAGYCGYRLDHICPKKP